MSGPYNSTTDPRFLRIEGGVVTVDRSRVDRAGRAALRLVHHYYCDLPTVGRDRCVICAGIKDPTNRGTMTVLMDDLREALG